MLTETLHKSTRKKCPTSGTEAAVEVEEEEEIEEEVGEDKDSEEARTRNRDETFCETISASNFHSGRSRVTAPGRPKTISWAGTRPWKNSDGSVERREREQEITRSCLMRLKSTRG